MSGTGLRTDAYVQVLASVRGMKPAGIQRLLGAYPDPQRLEVAAAGDIADLAGPAAAGELCRLLEDGGWSRLLEQAELSLLRCRERGVTPVSLASDLYPSLLRLIPDPPPLLYACGNLQLLTRVDAVAVVGTRNPTELGLRIARKVARHFAERGYVIVSGLAKGIDTAAHLGALDAGGATVAVLGTPLDRIYPAENRPLAERILEAGGLLVSERPPGASVNKRDFVRRDRIQSGLSLAVFPIQTGIAGGTLHTVKFARAQGRLLFCPTPPPGESHLPQWAGVVYLIRMRQATAFDKTAREQAGRLMDALRRRERVPALRPSP
jgi:DNA processing protein